MQLQGKKRTNDFLSLYTEDSSFQHREPRHSSQQGYGLKMHNFLQPSEPAEQGKGDGIAARGTVGVITMEARSAEQVLAGGIGTFSISKLPNTHAREKVGTDGRGTFAPVFHGIRAGSEPETDGAASVCASYPSAPSTTWQDSGVDPKFRGLAVRAEAKSSSSSGDQMPNTPRSKHSATEQRRRTKINDRFKVLRELLPHCDQKRDKASFLLEVIEYIRFLQEKVEKYESADPEWNQEDTKSIPWVKVYYKSCWKNTQGDGLSASQGGQLGANGIAVAPAALLGRQFARGVDTNSTASQKVTGASENCKNAENTMHHDQPQWLRMSTVNQDRDAARGAMSNEQHGLTLYNSTNNISSVYSRGLLASLAQALKKSGIDPSQANISVQINMSRGPKGPNADTTPSSFNACEGEESIQATKRPRVVHN